MSAGSWESFFEVGQWPAQLAASPLEPEPEAPGAPQERKSIFD